MIQYLLCLLFIPVSFFSEVIGTLSSDDYAGRKMGTTAEYLSANFIAEKYADMMLSPITEDTNDCFFQSFRTESYYDISGTFNILFDNHSISLDKNNFAWLPKTRIGEGKLECVLLDCNYDCWNDIEKDVKNRVVFLYAKKEKNPIGQQMTANVLFQAGAKAINAGAKAIIYICENDLFTKFAPHRRVYLNYADTVFILAIKQHIFDSLVDLNIYNRINDLCGKHILYNAETLNFSICFSNSVQQYYADSYNVVARKDGLITDTVVIIGAHYDHLGKSTKNDSIFYGADDNASGVAMLLAIAQQLNQIQTKYTVVFCAFSGEENACIGSKYFTENMPWDKSQIKCYINLDVIGGTLQQDTLFFQKSQDIQFQGKELKKIILKETMLGMSDHFSFLQKGIPYIYFSSGYSNTLHTHQDTKDKINYFYMQQVFDCIMDFITYLSVE